MKLSSEIISYVHYNTLLRIGVKIVTLVFNLTQYMREVLNQFQKVFHSSIPQVKLFSSLQLALYLMYISIDVYLTALRHVSGADQHWWFLGRSHYSISEWWLHKGWCICGLKAQWGGMGGVVPRGGYKRSTQVGFKLFTILLQFFYSKILKFTANVIFIFALIANINPMYIDTIST